MPPAHLKGPPVNYVHKAGCTGKTAYVSAADAKVTMRKRNMKHRPYQCNLCGLWHLSSRAGPISFDQ